MKAGIGDEFAQSVSHGIAGGTISVMQGGRFGHGFLSAGVSKAATPGAMALSDDIFVQGFAVAIVGGTTSEISGGKFANGATTAAMAFSFNHLAHEASLQNPDERFQITDEQRQLAIDGERRAFWESRLASGDPIAPLALDIIDNVGLDRIANEWLLTNARLAGVQIDLDQIGIDLMNRHIEFTDRDTTDTRGLLSPRQVARFHHLVFESHGLPPTAFGGTPITGQLREANFTRDIWCGGCDR